MKKLLFVAVIATLLFSGCGGEDPSVKLGKELGKNYTYDGQQIELEGYLTADYLNFIFGEKVSLLLYTKAQNGELIARAISVNFGTGPNSVHFPEKFKKEDVEIYDKDGQKYKAMETKVKITGTVVYTAKGPKKESSSKLNIPKVPKANDAENDGNDYTYSIKDVTITKM